jgi:hypothetical protein
MQAIAAIIGAIVVIYLYFLLVQWLFIAVGPIIIIAGSIIGTGAIPVIYGLQLFRIFDKPTWRRIFWTPVFALLALIYVDLVYIVVNVLAAIVRVPAIAATEVAIRPILALTGNTPTVIGFTSIFGPAPNWWVYILLGTLVKGVAIVALALIIRGLENTVKDTRQPAYRQYLFGQATADLGKVVEETPKMFVDIISKAGMWIYEVSYGPQAIALWPISLTAYAAFVPPAIVGIVSFAILMTTHLIGIGIVWALNLYVSALLFCTERAVVLARSGYAKCPHAGCHEPVPLPLFYCPNCGAEHSKLIPGICGIFYRACSCGTSLPTTFWLGKGKLRSACASCRRPLHQQLFRDSAHVPIYGAASSGNNVYDGGNLANG